MGGLKSGAVRMTGRRGRCPDLGTWVTALRVREMQTDLRFTVEELASIADGVEVGK